MRNFSCTAPILAGRNERCQGAKKQRPAGKIVRKNRNLGNEWTRDGLTRASAEGDQGQQTAAGDE